MKLVPDTKWTSLRILRSRFYSWLKSNLMRPASIIQRTLPILITSMSTYQLLTPSMTKITSKCQMVSRKLDCYKTISTLMRVKKCGKRRSLCTPHTRKVPMNWSILTDGSLLMKRVKTLCVVSTLQLWIWPKIKWWTMITATAKNYFGIEDATTFCPNVWNRCLNFTMFWSTSKSCGSDAQ